MACQQRPQPVRDLLVCRTPGLKVSLGSVPRVRLGGADDHPDGGHIGLTAQFVKNRGVEGVGQVGRRDSDGVGLPGFRSLGSAWVILPKAVTVARTRALVAGDNFAEEGTVFAGPRTGGPDHLSVCLLLSAKPADQEGMQCLNRTFPKTS